MARTIGHVEHRYEGYKAYLAEKRDRKYGARQGVRQALARVVREQAARTRAA